MGKEENRLEKERERRNSRLINGTALGFSLAFLLAALAAASYTETWGSVLRGWHRILISPCPLVTDYFAIGGLASTLLNAGACGLACCAFMLLSGAVSLFPPESAELQGQSAHLHVRHQFCPVCQ